VIWENLKRVVLLAVAVLTPEAYSVVVAEELEQETGKTVSTGAVHAALQRLENKGLVCSTMGEATPERGGRRKRIFTLTVAGSRMLHEVREVRNHLWERIAPETLPGIKMVLRCHRKNKSAMHHLPAGRTNWWNFSALLT
jgi:PadR family transcriptional regulator PadR